MTTSERPAIPCAQKIYGELIYWLAIAAAIVCMVGPLVAMADVENNVLNPHYVFSAIFEEKTSAQVWSIGAVGPILHDGWETALAKAFPDEADQAHKEAEEGETVIHPFVDKTRLGGFKDGQLVVEADADLVDRLHGAGLLARMQAAVPDAGVTSVEIQEGVVRGGHFWMSHLTTGDGFTQLGLVLGCGCALWGLIATAACFILEKPRVYLYFLLSLWVAALITLSATGAVSGGH